jgi:magnesium-transporting ATPase (P-type)
MALIKFRKEVTGMSHWHSMKIGQVLEELNTDPYQGLGADEAQSRLQKYGYNELTRKGQSGSPPKPFINRFNKMFIIICAIAVFFSTIVVPLLYE